jgi:DNA-binding NarL/FixJ family response regulator
MRIFVADDSAMLRERMIRLLSELSGIEVVGQAQDAFAAFEAICEAKPDIVTLDIELIGGSGIDVLRQIKNKDCSTVVIMLTNNSTPPYRRKCMEAGADYFFDKSTDFEKLKAVLQVLSDRANNTVAEAPVA